MMTRTQKDSNKNEVLDEIKTLRAELKSFKDEIINKLRTENKQLKDRIDNQDSMIQELQLQINLQDQYSRRQNLEIAGIPDSVEQKELEDTVISIFNNIGVKVKSEDIVACHRLQKSKKSPHHIPARTIVRMVNRKNCEKIKRNRKNLANLKLQKLKNTKIFINENLCPAFQTLSFHARNLYKNRQIHANWSSNGIVHIRIAEEDKALKIYRLSDLRNLFKDVDFS